MRIRPALPNDLNGLVDLENLCFTSDKLERKHYRALLTKTSATILIAEQANQIIGCTVMLFRKNSSLARMYSLAVNPTHRHTGIAKKLCVAMEEQVKNRHCTAVILEVRKDNDEAMRFYQKNGYQIFGSYTKFYEDGADAFRMRKNL